MDFDDLIMTTVNLLQAFPDVAEPYRRRFRQVLVDAYEDTNHAQYVLVRELVSPAGGPVPPAELCFVGDADQTIYACRGATIHPLVWAGALPHGVGERPHLEAGFPLRCFQRLSLPNVAHQQGTWRYNWHTRGSSVPVLSY